MPNPNASYQEELFREFSGETSPKRGVFLKESLFAARLISFDYILFAAIAGVVALVLVFSLGVERGKKIAKLYEIPASVSENRVVTSMIRGEDQTPTQSVRVSKKGGAASGEKGTVAAVSIKEVQLPPLVVTQKQNKESPAGKNEQKGYTVQVATYRDKKSAEKMKEEFRLGGKKAFLLLRGDFMAVCVGEYSTPTEASKAAKTFKKQFPDCFVKKL